MTSEEIQEINNAIRAAGAKWNAGETSLTKIPRAERLKHLGYVPGPKDKSLQERERISKANLEKFHMSATVAAALPATYDLRNIGGQNYITPIRDQGGCGSCVAFGTVATVEGTSRRQSANPNLNIDLSEAHLFYCYARNEGRRCGGPDGGWWPYAALEHFKNDGVVDEACYPYTSGDQNCSNLCTNWNSLLNKIKSYQSLTSTTDMKNWISTKGPLVTAFTIYDDFFYYFLHGGIYVHVLGFSAGGHCVSVVGYNDTQQYWICKNSWGDGWGERGFFRIAYGQCGIDAEMWGVDIWNIGSWLKCIYLDLLNRQPDQQGFNDWLNAINSGSTVFLVLDGFLRSQEYCTNVANSLYNQLLDRQSDPGGLINWRDFLANGNSIQNAIVGFCDSQEYKIKHPIPNQFVESLYNKLLGRPSDPSGLQGWVNVINTGTSTADVIRGFLRSKEYALQRINELYQKFLERQPNTGLLTVTNFWIIELQHDVSIQEIMKAILTSTDYLVRSQSR